MALLSLGTPLDWLEAKKLAEFIRREGIEQFINAFYRSRSLHQECMTWGDEIEYILVEFDDTGKCVKLSLRGEEVVQTLTDAGAGSTWHPEFAKFMLESTPSEPYSRCFKNFLTVETNMKARRIEVNNSLGSNESILSIVNFPRLGCPDSLTLSRQMMTTDASRSCFVPDEVINSHVRFKTLASNIRQRRDQKVEISVPLFIDKFTDTLGPCNPELMEFPENIDNLAALNRPDKIYLDCMAFGMGCCCLQLTMQTCDLDEARYLYDQLAVISPIILALTAASPVFRGFLADVDCRWSVIEASVDDRTREERGLEDDVNKLNRIDKSRYSTVSRYISTSPANRPEYSDLFTPVNKEAYERLVEAGIDPVLASHIGHLFIRDPLVIYRELLQQDNTTSSDHFENIQSTNWQTCRFKPPSLADPSLGWRIEFRPMEVQIRDRDNAAFVIYMVLLSRTILHYRLAFYLPLSLVDQNMIRAQKRDAVLCESFYHRNNVNKPVEAAEIMQLNANQIINGDSSLGVTGLSEYLRQYLKDMAVDEVTSSKLNEYIDLVSQRASAQEPTNARYIRNFITNHPEYRQDSVVSETITYDLLKHLSTLNDTE